MKDPYAALGVAKTASASEIKSAFRKLAKKFHPDANKDDPKAQERFTEASRAYEIVGDEEKRKKFDRGEIDAEGRETFQGFGGGNPYTAYDGFDARGKGGGFEFRAGGQGAAEDILSELFGSAFGGARRGSGPHPGFAGAGGGPRQARAQPQKGKDIEADLTVTVGDLMGDRKARLTLPDGRTVAVTVPQGKRGLILGLANNRSIAWGIAKAHAVTHGAELGFTYQGDALKKRVEPLAKELDGEVFGHCDVTDAASMDAVMAAVEAKWGKLDFLVHAIAFSDKDELTGRYVDTSAENFDRSMNISVYSFTALMQRAEKLMSDGGSILTLTYYGAERVMPHYNVMGVAKAALEASVRYLAADLGGQGIRVNALSAGPIKTLAASGIGDFRYILKWNEYNSPLRRTVTIEEVGDARCICSRRCRVA
jgi:enoyl-[acyl-carrier protein] reductase I